MRGVSEFQEQAVIQRGGEREEKRLCSHGTAGGGEGGTRGEEEQNKKDFIEKKSYLDLLLICYLF